MSAKGQCPALYPQVNARKDNASEYCSEQGKPWHGPMKYSINNGFDLIMAKVNEHGSASNLTDQSFQQNWNLEFWPE
jgi:hypothetical protein